MLLFIRRSAFFVTFWQMTLYDLIYPKERYDAEVSRLKGLQREAATTVALQSTDRDTFIDKIIDLATKLMAEMGRHFSASRGATRRLEKEKNHWFEGETMLEISYATIELKLIVVNVRSGNDSRTTNAISREHSSILRRTSSSSLSSRCCFRLSNGQTTSFDEHCWVPHHRFLRSSASFSSAQPRTEADEEVNLHSS